MLCRSSCKAAILQIGVHWTGEEDDWQEMDYDNEDWNHGHQNGTTPMDTTTNLISRKRTGPRTYFYEIDDYVPNDITFSDHYPALLDQTVETQEGDTSKLETVQEAVAAANTAADMSRRTWTQARQLMKDVHWSRGCIPVSEGNMMEVDQGKGKSRGKKGRSSKGKEKRKG